VQRYLAQMSQLQSPQLPSKSSVILALDLSTKTGWAVLEAEAPYALVDYGRIVVSKGDMSKLYKYPLNYLYTAEAIANEIFSKVAVYLPVTIVFEETNTSRSRYTQKVLEYIHFACISLMRHENLVYVNTSDWRRSTDVFLSKEDKKNNGKLSKAKSKAKKAGIKLDKKAIGIKGRVTKKHAAVKRTNELYGLNLKIGDNDMADAILLGHAYLSGVPICDGEQ
jgi:6-pyruvoyl-tetrahydropterin synthase